MKRLFWGLIILCFLTTPVFAANEWRDALTTFFTGATTYFNDVDTEIDDHVIEPLERILRGYREGSKVSYATAATLSVAAGEVACANSAGTLLKMRRNTSSTTVTWSNIDTGSEAASTTYYVYAVADADATTFTIVISKSATAPTGVTYYKKLGSFYNNSSSNILNDETVTNDNDYFALEFGDWESKSASVTYTATTDGYVMTNLTGNSQTCLGYTDASNPPTTLRMRMENGGESGETYKSGTMLVKKGDYWKVTGNPGLIFWLPSE